MSTMHEVDYKISGDDMQYVEVELDPMEAAVAEAGGMMYMDDGIEMETIFGDGSQQSSGFLNALVGAGKRLLTGESLFMTVLRGPGRIWLQSLPFSRMADRIIAASPRAGGHAKEEGSILGGIGRILDGDNS